MEEILTKYAGKLIANQAADFKKQDGVTEIEEALEANCVERALNDALLADARLATPWGAAVSRRLNRTVLRPSDI